MKRRWNKNTKDLAGEPRLLTIPLPEHNNIFGIMIRQFHTRHIFHYCSVVSVLSTVYQFWRHPDRLRTFIHSDPWFVHLIGKVAYCGLLKKACPGFPRIYCITNSGYCSVNDEELTGLFGCTFDVLKPGGGCTCGPTLLPWNGCGTFGSLQFPSVDWVLV